MSKRNKPTSSASARAAETGFRRTASPFSAFTFGSGGLSLSASPLSAYQEPPDLGGISNPSVVVLFKNLSKHSDVTKSKALDELQKEVERLNEAKLPLDDGFLSAWVSLYPRLSVDNSRAVRLSAHTTMGMIGKKEGKRVAPLLKKVAGAWLAGQFDPDKSVAASANQSLIGTFGTDKIARFLQAYQEFMLEYYKNIIVNETVGSLSDERTVSADDAAAKFALVIGTAIFSIAQMLRTLDDKAVDVQSAEYQDLFSSSKLWAHAIQEDPFIRKSVYTLTGVAVRKRKALILDNSEKVANAVLWKSMETIQRSALSSYLDLLIVLAKDVPEIWNVAPKSKKGKERTPLNVFIKFVNNGAKDCPAQEFWSKLSILGIELGKAAHSFLPIDPENAKKLLSAMQEGAETQAHSRRDNSSVFAWRCFFDYVYTIVLNSTDQAVTDYISKDIFLGLFNDFMLSDKDASLSPMWEVYGQGLLGAVQKGRKIGEEVFEPVWKGLEETVLNQTKIPSSEQSIGSWPKKWCYLVGTLLKKLPESATSRKLVLDSTREIYLRAIMSVGSLNDKSTACAAIIRETLALSHVSLWTEEEIRLVNRDFYLQGVSALLGGPLADDAITILIRLGEIVREEDFFQEGWIKAIGKILSLKDGELKRRLVQRLLSECDFKVVESEDLRDFVLEVVRSCVAHSSAIGRDFTQAALGSRDKALSDSTVTEILELLAEALSNREKAVEVAGLMETYARKDTRFFTEFISTSGESLLTNLLALTHVEDSSLDAAHRLASMVSGVGKSKEAFSESNAEAITALSKIISLSAFRKGTDGWIPVEHLVARAVALLKDAHDSDRAVILSSLTFDDTEWEAALEQLMRGAIPRSIAMTNKLGGAVYLVPPSDKGGVERPMAEDTWDELGYSSAWRMAAFLTEILKESSGLSSLSDESKQSTVLHLLKVIEIAKDNLDVAGANALWIDHSSAAREEIAEHLFEMESFTSHAYKLVSLDSLVERCVGKTISAFYNARVLSRVLQRYVDDGASIKELPIDLANDLGYHTEETLRSCAILSVVAPLENDYVPKFRDRLIRDVTSIDRSKSHMQGINNLILLNAILSAQEGAQSPLPLASSALRVFISHILKWNVGDGDKEDDPDDLSNPFLIAETAKILQTLLPLVSTVQGEMWLLLGDFLIDFWKKLEKGIDDASLTAVYHTVKLYRKFKLLPKDENDDLFDAWEDCQEQLLTALSDVLTVATAASYNHTPRENCYALIERETQEIPLSLIKNPEKFYKLLAVKSASIQAAAFGILHRFVPSIQEEISVEVALSSSKENPTKPEIRPELLSLLLNSPEPGAWEEAEFDKEQYLIIKSYILAWLLIFDHFQNCTLLVKTAYIEILSKGEYAKALWEFTFNCLGLSRGKSVDASTYSIELYDPQVEDQSLRDLKWALIHIYYLALKNAPAIASNWWRDQSNRQTSLAVESFTAKYISPLIIRAELDSVREWRTRQDSGAGDADDVDSHGKLTIKISPGANEVIAVYTVDEHALEVAIRLSSAYPLQKPTVESISRVGISEKQFASVIRATQATMALHSGSVVEALILYKKNLDAHFGGITECAICYSILSIQERTLPQKQCSTCKNKFHSACLFKWFRTSGSSSCPLCRNSWQVY